MYLLIIVALASTNLWCMEEAALPLKISKTAYYLAQDSDENRLKIDLEKAKCIQRALNEIVENESSLKEFKAVINLRLVLYAEKNTDKFSPEQRNQIKKVTEQLGAQRRFHSASAAEVVLDQETNIEGALKTYKMISALQVGRDLILFCPGERTDITLEETQPGKVWLFTFKKFGFGPEKLWKAVYDRETQRVLRIQSPAKKNTDIINNNDGDSDDSDDELYKDLPIMLGNCVII